MAKENQSIQLLGDFAEQGFNLQENSHMIILLYFKEAYIDEFDLCDVTPGDVQRSCRRYLNSLSTTAY